MESGSPLHQSSHASLDRARRRPKDDRYQYKELQKGEFRLLTFLDDEGLTLSVSTHEIGQAPSYVALSYTWNLARSETPGPADHVYRISLDGLELEISQNLYNALCHVAADVRFNGCMFWADAICINQADLDERSDQVPRMRRIFEESQAVFGWLGMPSDEFKVKLGVELMEKISSWYWGSVQKHNGDTAAIYEEITSDHRLFPSDPTSLLWKQWLGMAEMLTRPYWQRLWVGQEVTTPGDFQFYCGKTSFNMNHLRAVHGFGYVFNTYPAPHDAFRSAAGSSSDISHICRAHRLRELGIRQSLLEQMTWARPYRCEDAKDKVFVPVSCATDVTPGQIVVDYRRDLLDVYADVVRFCLGDEGDRGLIILGEVVMLTTASHHLSIWKDFLEKHHQTPELQWPSWLPDWRLRAHNGGLAFLTIDYIEGPYTGPYLYKPIHDASVEARFHGLELELKGYVRQDIFVTYLTDCWDTEPHSLSTPRSWYNDIVADGGKHFDGPIRRSLIGNKSSLPQGPPGSRCYIYRLGDALEWSVLERDIGELGKSTRDRRQDLLDNLIETCYHRRMAKTSGGQIAIVPPATEIGDRIAAFFGGGCLYVLRSIPGRQCAYNFVGECYVDGMMDGAFLDGASEYDKTERGIILV